MVVCVDCAVYCYFSWFVILVLVAGGSAVSFRFGDFVSGRSGVTLVGGVLVVVLMLGFAFPLWFLVGLV